MTKFVAEITVGKRDRLVTLRIPAGNTIAPSLRQVSVTFDGETSHHHREPISSTVLEYHPMPGTHRLEIDFGGPMPAATLILPEQTTAIISPIPALYNDATGMLSTAGHIWNPIKPPRQLTHLVSSLFAHNTHLVALSGTFAGLTALTEVPESLFFPLIYARTFTGVFALSGLAHVSRQLFTANLQAEDFSEAFRRRFTASPGSFPQLRKRTSLRQRKKPRRSNKINKSILNHGGKSKWLLKTLQASLRQSRSFLFSSLRISYLRSRKNSVYPELSW